MTDRHGEPEAQAWALKERCHAAWNVDPGEAAAAAAELRALAAGSADDPRSAVTALADWCDGIVHLAHGRAAEADAALQQAQRRFDARGEPQHAAQTQVARLMALALLGRFADALACGNAAHDVLLAAGDVRAAAKIRLNLGSLALHRDAYAEAATCYREAAVRFARVGDTEHSVMADVGLADALVYLGDTAEAALIYRRAAMRARTHGLPMLQAGADHGRALLDLALGRHGDALAGLERSRRAFAALQARHQQTEVELTLADAYLELGLLPEAIALYRALSAPLRDDGALATLAWTQTRLAQALALRGERGPALAALAEAEALFYAQGNAAGAAGVSLVRAQLALAGGDAARALELAESAEAGLRRAGSAELQPLARLHAAEARLALGDARGAAADCAALLADGAAPRVRVRALSAQAAAEWTLRPGSAHRALDEAIDAAEDLRAALPGDDLRRAVLADLRRPFVQRLQLALDDAEAEPARNAEVLHWLERLKARTLADRLGPGAGQAAPGSADAGRAAWRAQLERLARRRLEVEDADERQALHERVVALERALLESARRDRLVGAQRNEPAATRPRDARSLLQSLADRLPPDDALVEYGVAGDELFALVLRRGRLDLFRRLAALPELAGAVRALRFQIDAPRAGDALAAHAPLLLARAQRRLEQLHALVWAPLQSAIGDARRVIVVPHGVLHGVPFAALGASGDALVDRHEVCHAASATVALDRLDADPVAPRHALLVGDGTRLPQVERELHALTALFPQAERLLGAAATVDEVCRRAAAAPLLHLACHGEFRADSPLFSALHLADGRLTAARIETLPVAAALVVLSACETALAEPGAGDEGVGLVRAFLIAGAQRVLGSLWPVGDADTAELMRRFHEAWRRGGAAAAALRDAQRAQRALQPHPFHWAAFCLHGGG